MTKTASDDAFKGTNKRPEKWSGLDSPNNSADSNLKRKIDTAGKNKLALTDTGANDQLKSTISKYSDNKLRSINDDTNADNQLNDKAGMAVSKMLDKKPTPKPKPKSAPVESSSSRASRQAAYDDWVKSNRDPMSQLAKDRGVLNSRNTPSDLPVKPDGMRKGGKVTCMKSGGPVKSSASSRGDGCAQRGKTRGKWV